jgi:hypothetical protein
VRHELISLLRYLKLCMYFSKKPYDVFMEFGGYAWNDVLTKKSKGRVRKYQSALHSHLSFEIIMQPLIQCRKPLIQLGNTKDYIYL